MTSRRENSLRDAVLLAAQSRMRVHLKTRWGKLSVAERDDLTARAISDLSRAPEMATAEGREALLKTATARVHNLALSDDRKKKRRGTEIQATGEMDAETGASNAEHALAAKQAATQRLAGRSVRLTLKISELRKVDATSAAIEKELSDLGERALAASRLGLNQRLERVASVLIALRDADPKCDAELNRIARRHLAPTRRGPQDHATQAYSLVRAVETALLRRVKIGIEALGEAELKSLSHPVWVASTAPRLTSAPRAPYDAEISKVMAVLRSAEDTPASVAREVLRVLGASATEIASLNQVERKATSRARKKKKSDSAV